MIVLKLFREEEPKTTSYYFGQLVKCVVSDIRNFRNASKIYAKLFLHLPKKLVGKVQGFFLRKKLEKSVVNSISIEDAVKAGLVAEGYECYEEETQSKYECLANDIPDKLKSINAKITEVDQEKINKSAEIICSKTRSIIGDI